MEAQEKLPDLPQGWAYAKIGEICSLVNGRAFKAEDWSSCGLPIIRIQNLNNHDAEFNYCSFDVEDKYYVDYGQLLFAWSGTPGTSFGAHIWSRGKGILNQHIFKVDINEQYLNKKFLMNTMNYNVDLYIKKAHGTAGLAHITKGKFEESLISLPPLPEQHRIVTRIEELFSRLDAGVEALRRAKAQLQRYRQSVLQAAVEGRLTAEWRAAHPEVEPAEKLLEGISKFKPIRSEKFKEGLPEAWAWATMEQLTSKVTSGSRGWARYYSDFGAIFIRAQDIKTDHLLLDQAAFVEIPSNSEGTRTRVQLGDILIVITGANVTKSAIVEFDLGGAYVSQHVGLIRPAIPDLGPYLYTYIIAPKYGRGVLKKEAYGAGKPGLNLDNIRNLLVRLPPLSEQNKIVEEVGRCMSIADKIEEIIHTHIKLSNRLRQSILKSAFEGRLVPQDPNDEPASLLLERIRAKRIKEPQRRGRKSNHNQSRLDQ